jgi:hypothetical protein
MIKHEIITNCYYACPFFKLDTGAAMYCNHPKLDGAKYEQYIINEYNCHNRVPEECPLRTESVTIEVSLG